MLKFFFGDDSEGTWEVSGTMVVMQANARYDVPVVGTVAASNRYDARNKVKHTYMVNNPQLDFCEWSKIDYIRRVS